MTDAPLFLLAMDHRESLARTIYGIRGDVPPADAQRIAAGKQLVFAGLRQALAHGAEPRCTGVLVDERYGAQVARDARAAGLTLVMPIERSGQPWFELEYGTLADGQWLEHLAAFAPAYVKVLIRDNPNFDAAARKQQQDDLAQVSAKLHEVGRPLLIELLVPATPEQRTRFGAKYDVALRPALTEKVIAELQAAGVEPAIWKIEGLDSAAAAAQIVALTQRNGRGDVRCIVLGRDAPQLDLDRWLRVAAGVPGFRGFAIGRSIWERPWMDWVAGKQDEAGAQRQIAENYLHYVNSYRTAAANAVSDDAAHHRSAD